MDLRQHGDLPDSTPQFVGPVEGVCRSVNTGDSTVYFVIPTYSSEQVWGPAPFVGGSMLIPVTSEDFGNADNTPEIGSRLLVVFAQSRRGARPWVVGWTNQP